LSENEDKQTDAVYASVQAAYDQGFRNGQKAALMSFLELLEDADDLLTEFRRITWLDHGDWPRDER
jgi:hypothetical protein